MELQLQFDRKFDMSHLNMEKICSEFWAKLRMDNSKTFGKMNSKVAFYKAKAKGIME